MGFINLETAHLAAPAEPEATVEPPAPEPAPEPEPPAPEPAPEPEPKVQSAPEPEIVSEPELNPPATFAWGDLHRGDALAVLRSMEDDSMDSIVTDPPYGLSKEPDMAEVLTHWLAGDDYAHRGRGFMGKCLHPDTDLLTDAGWKPVSMVMQGDRVASLDQDSGEIAYTDVVSIHEYDFDGDLLSIGGRSTRQVVTPNHQVWTDRGLVRADELPRTFKLYNQGVWNGRRQDSYEVEGAAFGTDHLMRFLGLWLGDGYVVHRVNQPWKQDFIGFNVSKPRKVEAIRQALDDLGVRYTLNEGERSSFYVYDKHLLAWLSPQGGAHSKFIPTEVFDLDQSHLEHLYQGMVDTDGTRQINRKQGRAEQHVYYTVSDALADDFQRLCLHTGRAATKSWREGETNFGDSRGWVLSVLQRPGGYWMERDGRTNRPQPSAVSRLPYVGKVHCVTLERHHVMLSRFEGRMAWTGNSWDSFVPGPSVWRECLRVLKPGGHLLCFAGSRTVDIMGISIRLGGFEIRDQMQWVFGSGFPKSQNVAKMIDKAAGAKREMVGTRTSAFGDTEHSETGDGRNLWVKPATKEVPLTGGPVTPDAARWEGWGTALKPAHEPIIVARKPLSVDGKKATVVKNVLAHGTGALNIDATRIGTSKNVPASISRHEARNDGVYEGNRDGSWGNEQGGAGSGHDPNTGRWPANVLLTHHEECKVIGIKKIQGDNRKPDQTDGKRESGFANVGAPKGDGKPNATVYGDSEVQDWKCHEDCPVAILDAQSGERKAGGKVKGHEPSRTGQNGIYGMWGRVENAPYVDTGGASRFFYQAKVSKSERNAGLPEGMKNQHPTVKPVKLMAYLVRMVTPPGGAVLDPYCGSGSTGVGAVSEGFRFVGIDLDDEDAYLAVAELRIEHAARGRD